jgi:hypothetical protein
MRIRQPAIARADVRTLRIELIWSSPRVQLGLTSENIYHGRVRISL